VTWRRPRSSAPRALLSLAAVAGGALLGASAAPAAQAHHCGSFDFGSEGGYSQVTIIHGSCALARRVLGPHRPAGWSLSHSGPEGPGHPFGFVHARKGRVRITAQPTD
jgi:hypothetical protein